MRKRRRFVLTALLLAIGLVVVQSIKLDWRYWAIAGLGLAAYLLSAWALFDDLKGIEWLTVLVLPTLYPVSVALFYFLLPSQVLSRILILFLFSLGMYALLLTENIFSVAAVRTIQLLRAANAVGFLLSLVTAFFIYDTILSLKFYYWINGLLVLLVSWLILLVGIWTVPLSERLDGRIVSYSLMGALALAELAVAISFWPLTVATGSIILVTMMYIFLGLIQHYFSGRLFRKVYYEYLGVGIAVFLITFLLTSWRG